MRCCWSCNQKTAYLFLQRKYGYIYMNRNLVYANFVHEFKHKIKGKPYYDHRYHKKRIFYFYNNNNT